MSKIRLLCPECESSQITCEATAYWDEKKQEWKLFDVLYNKSCQDCSTEFKDAKEEEIND